MRMLIAAAAIGAATPALAEPVWDKVEFGMNRQQIEALYPKGAKIDYQSKAIEISGVHIMGKCDAEANIYFNEADIVDRVKIAGNPSMGGRCSDQVMTALASKYGEPLTRDESFGTILSRQGKMMVWNRPGGVTMRFKKYQNGFFGGGGLLKASWELEYSKSGSDLTL